MKYIDYQRIVNAQAKAIRAQIKQAASMQIDNKDQADALFGDILDILLKQHDQEKGLLNCQRCKCDLNYRDEPHTCIPIK